MSMPTARWLAAAFAVCLFGSAAAAQMVPPEPAKGRAKAATWCSGCHVIDRAGKLGTDVGPPFPALAENPAKTAAVLRGFLSAPHAPMPEIPLDRDEIEHLIAYIQSLALDR